jgi:methionyl-tRNA formyltransferase
LPLLLPQSLREDSGRTGARETAERLRSSAPDLLVVAAYGLILPQAMLDAPRGIAGGSGVARAINIHASLLPRWRGAAPVARAIEAGDRVTGITLMQMDAGLDTGPILWSESMPIEATDTAGSLAARLGQLGARLVVSWLAEVTQGLWAAVPQPAEGVSTARKIAKQEAWLDWSEPAEVLERRVRAFDPEPGACGQLAGGIVKIWSAQAGREVAAADPGTVVSAAADGIRVACGDGVLVIHELQRAGSRRLRVREFLAGTPILAGTRWQAPATPGQPR